MISTFGSGENVAYNPYPWVLAANKKASHPDHGITGEVTFILQSDSRGNSLSKTDPGPENFRRSGTSGYHGGKEDWKLRLIEIADTKPGFLALGRTF